jgi:hypothetical protein
MICRTKLHIIGPSFVAILILASAGSKSAKAQPKFDAYYTAILGLPIGHISWAVNF